MGSRYGEPLKPCRVEVADRRVDSGGVGVDSGVALVDSGVDFPSLPRVNFEQH